MQQSAANHRWALVLAGGDGTRLRGVTSAVSGKPIPKQYCPLLGDRSLLEATLCRTLRFAPAEHTLVIVNDDHLAVGWEQLRSIPTENMLIQPANRETGPGLMYSLCRLLFRDPHATVAVFPSDHFVGDDSTFMLHVEHASELVRWLPDKIVLLGIRPDRAEPGLGYISPGKPIDSSPGESAAFHVDAFQEKPPADVADALVREGGLWNSFIMVFRLTRMTELLEDLRPDEFRRMWDLGCHPGHIDLAYRDLASWNFSTGFLSGIAEHLVVLAVGGVHWSDWGTPESIRRSLDALHQPLPPWMSPHPPIAA